MIDIEQKLIACGKEIKEAYVLKKSERIRISHNILSHDHQNAPNAIPSPYHKVRFPHFFFMSYGSIALLFAFIFTGVLSYIAEASLPGDPLYTVKTNFDENLQSAMTFSPQSKAKLQTSFTQNRLNEAEQLAATGRLSPDAEKTLADNFQKNLSDFSQSIKAVEADASASATGTASSTTIAGAISATTSIDISSYDPKTLTENQAKTLSYEALQDISLALDNLLLPDTLATSSIVSVSTSSPADTVIISSSTHYADAPVPVASSTASSTPAATSTSAETPNPLFVFEGHIINAQSLANDGIALLGQGDYIGAFADFQQSLAEIELAQSVTLSTTGLVSPDGDMSSTTATSTGVASATSTATTTAVVPPTPSTVSTAERSQ